MTTTLRPGPDVSPRHPRTLPWYTFGLANLAVVVVLSLVTWYLFLDPQWSALSTYPQPLTAWMFWTIIAFVWAAFTLELSPFAGLAQPWKGLAVAVATGGIAALITWLLAFGWGAVDANFAASRPDGLGYVLGSLIVLYSFVLYTMSAVNWGHWPWPDRGLTQPWLGIVSLAGLAVPVLILYAIFAMPPLVDWAAPGTTVLGVFTQIGFFYSFVVSSILTGALLGNWPWRLAGSPGRVVLASTVGNLVLGSVFYFALGGIAQLVLGPANVAAIGEQLPIFAAQVGVCWVFWLVMWPNAFGNKPDGPGLGAMAARTAITLVLAVATFALYYWVLAAAVFHEPPAATGATVNGSALVAIDWLIIIALWYVAAAESWGLPRMGTAGSPAVEKSSVGSEQS